MLMRMLTAFICTGIANIGTHITHLAGNGIVVRHNANRHLAHGRAVAVQLNTGDEMLKIFFVKAGVCTAAAFYGTTHTELYALLKAFVVHNLVFGYVELPYT
jgi:hypothetical protein